MSSYQVSNQKVETEVHKIIQYLAAAGNSFLPKKKDDSHTNLKSLTGCGCLTTRPLNDNGDVLAFSYAAFSLEWWIGETDKIKLSLDGKTHKEVLDWIVLKAKENGIQFPYTYKMHYTLLYDSITDDYTYTMENKQRLSEIMHYRIMAHLALEDTLETFSNNSEIRVWPHHFDIAALYTLNKRKGHIIGLGMAIPDAIHSDFYLYAKGYAGDKVVDISDASDLDNGYWDKDFNGAVLGLTDTSTIQSGYQFFKQAIELIHKEGKI